MEVRADQRLIAIIRGWAPASVLVLGGELPGAAPEGARVLHRGLDEPPGADAEPARYDCAVVLRGDPPAVADDRLLLLLGRLKNLHSPRVALRLAAKPGKTLRTALLDLAFQPDAETRELWLHDIDLYNPRREWNTAENWAHPENFHKYRW